MSSSAHSPNFPSFHPRHSSFSNPLVASPTSQFILQPFFRFSYVTVHSPTLLSFLLRHSSFSNPSVASPTSQFILQPFFRFSYVTAHSPILPLLHLRHSSFSNPSFASPMSQDLHLIHLASCPCWRQCVVNCFTVLTPHKHKYSMYEGTQIELRTFRQLHCGFVRVDRRAELRNKRTC